jgi:putative ATP-dependent endonuclease of the OLD family
LKRELSSSNSETNASFPTEDEIRRLLDVCAEELKQIIINKRVARLSCRVIHPSLELVPGDLQEEPVTQRVIDENRKIIQKLEEANSRVEDVYQTESAQLNSIWHSSKLDLVPGDYLLDMVCQKYGVRFKKKEQDGSRLASLMYENEIDREIRDIIQSISKVHH